MYSQRRNSGLTSGRHKERRGKIKGLPLTDEAGCHREEYFGALLLRPDP